MWGFALETKQQRRRHWRETRHSGYFHVVSLTTWGNRVSGVKNIVQGPRVSNLESNRSLKKNNKREKKENILSSYPRKEQGLTVHKNTREWTVDTQQCWSLSFLRFNNFNRLFFVLFFFFAGGQEREAAFPFQIHLSGWRDSICVNSLGFSVRPSLLCVGGSVPHMVGNATGLAPHRAAFPVLPPHGVCMLQRGPCPHRKPGGIQPWAHHPSNSGV